MTTYSPRWTAFVESTRFAAGAPADVALQARAHARPGDVRIFDDWNGRLIDVDLRGTDEEVAARIDPRAALPPEADPAGPRRGRPRLGVAAREITLLPRHWEWLDGRDGGASVTLRRLVDAAMRGELAAERVRAAQEAAHNFLTAMAGNDPGYESALRWLYSGDAQRFAKWAGTLPGDIAAYARELAEPAFTPGRS